MPRYALTIVKTYRVEVVAESKQDAHEAVHNNDEYALSKCVEEKTESIIEIGKKND